MMTVDDGVVGAFFCRSMVVVMINNDELQLMMIMRKHKIDRLLDKDLTNVAHASIIY